MTTSSRWPTCRPRGNDVGFGSVTIETLPTPTHRVEVEVVDARTGEAVPARVRFVAPDGRYLPPLGHRDEINPGLNEDAGADVVLGGAAYAYVPGRFPIGLPAGEVEVEVVRGFGHRPLRRTVAVDGGRAPLVLPLEPVTGPAGDGWIAVDCHVHFISPTAALLQARAEGVAIVNLLATQWGDHHTSVTRPPGAVVADRAGDHIVVMGSENRQNMLGHIGLLGASDAVLPMASGGAPEARLGDPLDWLMADWADAARAQGGLAVAVHFPLPIRRDRRGHRRGPHRRDRDAGASTPGVEGPSDPRVVPLPELPATGCRSSAGTDKMSAESRSARSGPMPASRPTTPLSFDAWADAVRAGRTFVSSGAFVDLRVEGCGPGETVRLGRDGGTVEVVAEASAAQPVIAGLELVHDGAVVASVTADGTDRLTLSERVTVGSSGWLAARVASREQIHSAFATAMGAHSSPGLPGCP